MTPSKRARQKANRRAKVTAVKRCDECRSVRHRAPSVHCRRWRARMRRSCVYPSDIRDLILKANAKAQKRQSRKVAA